MSQSYNIQQQFHPPLPPYESLAWGMGWGDLEGPDEGVTHLAWDKLDVNGDRALEFHFQEVLDTVTRGELFGARVEDGEIEFRGLPVESGLIFGDEQVLPEVEPCEEARRGTNGGGDGGEDVDVDDVELSLTVLAMVAVPRLALV